MLERVIEMSKSSETVLVVDDEILIRLVIAEYLRDCGYKVIEAANAQEALLVLQQTERDVDVLFTDIEMPGDLDGFGLAQWVRSNRPATEVILTGSVKRAVNAASNLCEAQNHVPKPYEPQTVLERIQRLLANRTPGAPDSDAAGAATTLSTNGGKPLAQRISESLFGGSTTPQ